VRLRFTAHAVGQFSSIAEYIARDNPPAALNVGRRLLEACNRLTQLPSIGRKGAQASTRELVVRGLPYIVVYRVTAEEIVILGIYHGAQLRPGQSEL